MIWHIARHNKAINNDEINVTDSHNPKLCLLNKLRTTDYDSNTIKEVSHGCFDEEWRSLLNKCSMSHYRLDAADEHLKQLNGPRK